MKLRQKFFLSYFFIISAFSLVFVCSLSFFFAEQARQEQLASAEKTCSQTAALLDYQCRQYLYSLYVISNSEEVSHALEQAQADTLSLGQQYRECSQLRNVLNRSVLPLPDASVRIYIGSAYSTMIEHNLIEDTSVLNQHPWFQDFRDRPDQTMWIPTVQKNPYTDELTDSLSLFRKVGLESSWITELYIRQPHLREILAAADPTEKGAVFLQAEDGSLLCGTDETLSDAFLSHPNSANAEREVWNSFSLNGQIYSGFSYPVHSTKQTLTLLLPADSLSFSLRLLPKYAVWVLIGFIAVSIAAAHFFTNTFSRRLLHLDAKMSQLCDGDLDVHIEEQGRDEVAHLFRSFNHMTGEMKLLVHQQYENGIRVKTAELNALQAQINPHFLYNTLELINWKAMESDSPEIVRIAQNLADFYRLTLSNGKSMVPLNDELKLIDRYLDIQNFRFSRDIQFLVQVPEDCLSVFIPKLTLQPLVENSVLHGFLGEDADPEKENWIRLRVWREESDILLELSDNGCGMSEEKLGRILSGCPAEDGPRSHGFGVPNIQHRIQMLYGQDCGLHFAAGEGEGITVTIRIKDQTALA